MVRFLLRALLLWSICLAVLVGFALLGASLGKPVPWPQLLPGVLFVTTIATAVLALCMTLDARPDHPADPVAGAVPPAHTSEQDHDPHHP